LSNRIEVGLLWHAFDSGNHGVNALTLANLAIAAEAARAIGFEPHFTLFTPGRGEVMEVTPEGHAVVRLNRRTIITSRIFSSRVKQCHCVLDISAGDSFADIYGAKRFFWMWLTKTLVLRHGKSLLLSPQTIGPFTRQPYRWLAGRLMRAASLTVARDPLSYEAIHDLAPGAKRLLSSDVAFRLPFERRAKAKDGRIHVGINVSGLLWRQSGSGENAYGLGYDYAAMTSAVLDALAKRDDVVVHLVTHVVDRTLPDDTDSDVVDELALRYPRALRVPDFTGPSAAKSYIAGLDLLIAARMHACIAAFSADVPVVPVAYSRKFLGLFEGLLDYRHVLPQTGLNAAAAAAFILDRVDRRDELAAEVSAGNRRVAPLLDAYSEALRAFFAQSKGV
jgi:colanic acid/amylovoran biosynthesis protein